MNFLVVVLAVCFALCFARFAVRPMIDRLNHQQRVLRRRQLGMNFGDDPSQKQVSLNLQTSHHSDESSH